MNWCSSVLAIALSLGLVGLSAAAPITALSFSPDGQSLVSNGDRQLAVRSPIDAQILRHIPCELPKVSSLSFHPLGRCLAVGGGTPAVQGEVTLFSWPEGRPLHRLTNHLDLVTQVTFSSDGALLAVASADGFARIWNFEAGAAPTVRWTLTGHVGAVLGIAFSPSGRSIVTTGVDRSLKVWSRVDGTLQRSLSHHTEAVHALAFSPLASNSTGLVVCATGGDDRTVRIWQPEIGRLVRTIRHHEGSVLSLVWSADSGTLYSGGREGIIRQIDGSSDEIKARWPDHADWIYALALSSDGTRLASGDWSGQIRIRPR